MKTKTEKCFGVSRINVSLNLFDIAEMKYVADRIKYFTPTLVEISNDVPQGWRNDLTDAIHTLDMVWIFFNKIVKEMPELEEASIFTEETVVATTPCHEE